MSCFALPILWLNSNVILSGLTMSTGEERTLRKHAFVIYCNISRMKKWLFSVEKS